MSLFRSAEMKFFNIHIPKEDTYDVISRLAEHNFVQFIDSTKNAFSRPYQSSLRRCEEMISRVDEVIREIHNKDFELPQVPQVEFVFEEHRQYLKKHKMNGVALLDKVVEEVDQTYQKLDKSRKAIAEFRNKINEFQNYKYLLFKAREIFHSNKAQKESQFDKHSLDQLRLVNVSGILQSRDLHKFTRMIFRVTKGNSILYTFNIPQEEMGPDDTPMTAFICVVETGGILLTKLNRICESFGAKKYKLPTNKDQIFGKIKEIEDSVSDTKQLYVMAEKNYKEELQNAVSMGMFECSNFDAYRIILERQAIIFNTLNLMEETTNIMIGQIWVPTEKVGLLYSLLPSFVSLRESQPNGKQPPTHFQMNQFTTAFQEIVNTYGVPRYQEVNPALYAIGIFPLLFGIMFGDIGHGGVVLLFAIWLTNSSKAKKLIPEAYGIRYLLLLMGIFSFFSGWIYNEFFSIPINVFGSCYGHAEHEEYAEKIEGCVYPFGFDPKWIRASNELNYFNSYKMKFAVIIGVFQMTFAIFLKMMNTYHFKNQLDFFFEWLPQQIFFFCTFGYMCILIIYKWTIPWGTQGYDTSMAPSIIGQMIALPLKMGSTEGKPLWDMESQETLQYFLLMGALISVPIMLIPKPLIIGIQMSMNKKKPAYQPKRQTLSEEDLGKKLNESFADEEMVEDKRRSSTTSVVSHKEHEHEHDISEIAVHQIIETIEFVLGSISNTASYLRLWALSLAHGQLARVFLEKTIGGGIQSGNIIIILIGMFLFLNITLGVIMGMDSMECFLHALRLQWVEFQSKFFKADGWKFTPLTFVEPVQLKANNTRIFD